MKESLPKPTTFKELQERKEILERSMELNTYSAKQAFSEAGSELPKFLLKKVAVPAALVAAVAIGVDKLIHNSSSEEPSYQTHQEEENKEKVPLLNKIWLFALPIVQPYIRNFVQEQFINRFGNSGR